MQSDETENENAATTPDNPISCFQFPKVEVLRIQEIQAQAENQDPETYVQTFLQETRHPIILRGFDIGSCSSKWKDINYLKSINPQKPVKIHSSATKSLDFIGKNFEYKTISWAELIEHCSGGGGGDKLTFYYLRALGDDPRARDPANLSLQFPELSADLKIPSFFPTESFFSSVLRITSPNLQLWTHYDTCDNILIQTVGKKRINLFPPWEALNLYLEGDKSKVLNIDNPDLELFPNFPKAERLEAILEEGDIVFIPAFWFHNVVALEFSISVNVFWKNLPEDLYDKKDPYGNQDLVPAQLSFRTFAKATSQLTVLPKEYEDFYLRRMILSLQKKLDTLKLNPSNH